MNNTQDWKEIIATDREEATAQLYQLFKNKVCSVAYSYLRDKEEANDLTQEVFVRVYQTAQQWQGNASISTWIYRITINACLDRLRSQQRRRSFWATIGIQKPAEAVIAEQSVSDNADAALYQQDQARLLATALAKLPLAQQTAFILCFREELSGKEAAEVMQISEKALESLKQRAKANLRKHLEKFFPERRK